MLKVMCKVILNGGRRGEVEVLPNDEEEVPEVFLQGVFLRVLGRGHEHWEEP
jgi:hypothetical protein